MALVLCPECKKEVSDTAKACPHCGFNLAGQNVVPSGSRMVTLVIWAVVIFVAVNFLGILLMSSAAPR
ncbi:MAG: zinc ribbon domain-containing protein [Cytophagaceae bacterium]|nr:MAG: zinc ribbon domain-containing protein [Cytophagaceae bacterium]